MGKTYKDREKKGLPRVPNWARPKPEVIHEDDRKKRKGNRDREDLRDRMEEWDDE